MNRAGILLIALLPGSPLSGEDDLHWLKSPSLEAGFSTVNGIRLEVLKQPGEANLLRESTGPVRGMKTWIMTPADDLHMRDLLSECPGAMERVSGNELRLTSACENPLGLQLEWRVRVHSTEPVLEVVHVLHHAGEFPLYLSIWSLIAVDPSSVLQVYFSRSPDLPRNHPNAIGVFPFTKLEDGRIQSNKESLNLRIDNGHQDGPLKLGLVQQEGRLHIWRGETLLESTVPYDPTSDYPEGGWNVTLFASPADGRDVFGEAEHMGPLRILRPGQSMEMLQTLRLLRANGTRPDPRGAPLLEE